MKIIVVFIAVVFSVALLSIAVSAADVSVEADDQRIFNAEESSFYLPSYVSPSAVKLRLRKGFLSDQWPLKGTSTKTSAKV